MRPGDYDVCELYVGPPGCGKSWMLRTRALELGRTPAYVIAHDATGAFRDQPGARRHADEMALFAALNKQPGGVHVMRARDGLEVVRAALHVAHVAAMAAGGEKARDVVPVQVVIDEVALCSGVSPSKLDDQVREGVVTRRHLPPSETAMIGWLLATQYPAMVNPLIWLNCTKVVVFKLDSEDVADYLRRKCGMPRELLERAAKLEQLRSVDKTPRVEGRHYLVFQR